MPEGVRREESHSSDNAELTGVCVPVNMGSNHSAPDPHETTDTVLDVPADIRAIDSDSLRDSSTENCDVHVVSSKD